MANKNLIINSDYPIDIKILGLIQCISQEIQSESNRKLRPFNISNTQLNILHILATSNVPMLTVNQIKSFMVEESPNVSRSLNKLMENGFIVKERDAQDQRVVKIKITDSGQEIHKEADKALMAGVSSINLSSSDKKALYEILKKF